MTTAVARGREAEERAARFLAESHGFVVVEKNARSRRGEVDIIAWDGDTLCFVEVRARGSARFGTPGATVHGRKQRRIAHAALTYLCAMGGAPPPCRFDVVEIEGDAVRLLRAAFEAPA